MPQPVHYLHDEHIRCGQAVADSDLIAQTTDDFLQITCEKCCWLVINDAKPPALKKPYPFND